MIVWVCPTDGCGNYYAASSAGDLAVKVKPVSAQSGALPGSRGLRSACPECPECAARGLDVDRLPHEFTLTGDAGTVTTVSFLAALDELHEHAQGLATRTGFTEATMVATGIRTLREMVS